MYAIPAMLMKYCISPYSFGTSNAAMMNQKAAVIPEPNVSAIPIEPMPYKIFNLKRIFN